MQVFVTDLWTDHTPWPFNQLPRSYSFLVKHGALWKMTYYGTAPRLVHQPHFAATSTFIARWVPYSHASNPSMTKIACDFSSIYRARKRFCKKRFSPSSSAMAFHPCGYFDSSIRIS